jgi:signal transduction histidine kinase
MPAAERTDPILAFSQLVHDLKNQLTIVVACTDALARIIPDGVVDIELNMLVKSAERASALTDEFLIGAMIGGHPGFGPRPTIELNAATRATLPTLRRIAGGRIDLRIRESSDPLPVSAAMVQVERILINLVLNAADAMPDGGALVIETAMVPVAACPGGTKPPHVQLTVSDSGRGMTPEVKGRIFEPLFTTKPRGTGLGLTSVAYTVRQLEGTIAVDSGPSRGTTVTITLPLNAS